ncbi:MAG: MerR family transcriptional regulator [Acidimicrobiia bacterium]
MRIGEVADQAGITVDAVRYYERRGLLPAAARRPSGYRMFDTTTVERLDLIRQFQALGLTIAEIRSALAAHDAGDATCDSERWRIEAVRGRIDAKIAELTALRARVDSVLTACAAGSCALAQS